MNIFRQRNDGGVLHSKSSSQWSVCFDDDVVLLAEGGDLCSGVEWVHLDLVDSRNYSRLRRKKFLQLNRICVNQLRKARQAIKFPRFKDS